ncbi:MAG: universal stress protein [Nitrospiria bacterium]
MVKSQKKAAGAQLSIEKILVPVDFSVCSQETLEYACSLAKIFKAKIIVLHVMDLPAYWLETSMIPPGDRFGLNKKLEEMVKQQVNKVKVKGIDVEGVCEIGQPYSKIIEYVDKNGADLIVMGTHGRTGLVQMVLGSTTERVITHAPCPVLAIKAGKVSDLGINPSAILEKKRQIIQGLVLPGDKKTYCHLCALPSQDIICDSCKAHVRSEAFEMKMKVEKEGKVDTGRQ